MSDYDIQMGMDFFFGLDGETFGQFRVPGSDSPTDTVLRAEGPAFNVAGAFYSKPFPEYEAEARAAAGSMNIISSLIAELVRKHLGDFGVNLRSAWADFGQGILFDERRNVEVGEYTTLDGRTVEKRYDFWPTHAMDGWYEEEAKELGLPGPNPPGEYYNFYGAVRGFYLLTDSEEEKSNWLNFGRGIAIGSAAQNVAKPLRIIGPDGFPGNVGSQLKTPYPNLNKPIDPAIIQKFIDRYWSLSIEELDEAFKTGDDGILGGRRPNSGGGGGGGKSDKGGDADFVSPHMGSKS